MTILQPILRASISLRLPLTNLLSRLSHCTFYPHRAYRGHNHPEKPHHTSNNAVRNLALSGITTQLQPKPTIDDSQSNDNTPQPDVDFCPHRVTIFAFIDGMVVERERWLDKKQAYHNYANDGVSVGGCDLDNEHLLAKATHIVASARDRSIEQWDVPGFLA